MISPDQLRQFALSLPEAEEKIHFERASFRVRNKIFATLSEDETEAVLKLSVEEQTALVAVDPETFFLVGWNSQGWIGVRLGQVDAEEMWQLLVSAWRNVAPKRVVKAFDENRNS
jgi:hypothetical protein